LGWGHFGKKKFGTWEVGAFWEKKFEWSNFNNLEVWGVKCHVLNIGGQSANE
jgi:hypothetical protein